MYTFILNLTDNDKDKKDYKKRKVHGLSRLGITKFVIFSSIFIFCLIFM